jgi:hypothetical protein
MSRSCRRFSTSNLCFSFSIIADVISGSTPPAPLPAQAQDENRQKGRLPATITHSPATHAAACGGCWQPLLVYMQQPTP